MPLGGHFRLLSKRYLGHFLVQRQRSSEICKALSLEVLGSLKDIPGMKVGLIVLEGLFTMTEERETGPKGFETGSGQSEVHQHRDWGPCRTILSGPR